MVFGPTLALIIPRDTRHLPLATGVRLSLDNNNFRGNVNESISKLQRLQGLQLDGNKFSGKITVRIARLEKLGDVYSYGIMLLEVLTDTRPIDVIFKDRLNIHNYSAMPFA
ncbi:hypothetical protein KY284_007472 [Solanum tuberosum]|nr:hypothetical protein KY284_007472 [Solanum tuberosum]